MVNTKRGFVLAASFLSGTAAVLSLVSLGTEQWVTAQAQFTYEGINEQLSTIKYGLFSGSLLRQLGGELHFQIKATCLVSENVCAYLCKSSAEGRKEQLQQLYQGLSVEFDNTCPRVRRSNEFVMSLKKRLTKAGDEREFLSAGLYISTIVFLSLSVAFGLVSAVLSVWNVVANPIEVYLSIYGLYIYNTIASVACIMTLILWGALFGRTIVNDVGILYTIQGQMNSGGLAYLGFSYWLNLPSCLLYATSIAVLYVRHYLISQEPQIKIHATSGEKDVGDIMIY